MSMYLPTIADAPFRCSRYGGLRKSASIWVEGDIKPALRLDDVVAGDTMEKSVTARDIVSRHEVGFHKPRSCDSVPPKYYS